MPAPPVADGAEPTLVERFRRGDEEAFREIVAEHRRAVYRVAHQLLGNHGDADEAAQLTFVRAWQGRRRFRGDAALGTWLVRIALNVARSMLSRRRGGLEVAGPSSGGASTEVEAADRRLERREMARSIRAAVLRLAPRQREAVLLKVFSEMTCREVAGVMGLSEGAVKAHLYQAVSNLRRRLAPGKGPAEEDRG